MLRGLVRCQPLVPGLRAHLPLGLGAVPSAACAASAGFTISVTGGKCRRLVICCCSGPSCALVGLLRGSLLAAPWHWHLIASRCRCSAAATAAAVWFAIPIQEGSIRALQVHRGALVGGEDMPRDPGLLSAVLQGAGGGTTCGRHSMAMSRCHASVEHRDEAAKRTRFQLRSVVFVGLQ